MDFCPVVAKVSPSIAKVYCVDSNGILTTGSAFVFAKRGLLVTCEHIIAGTDRIGCRFPGDAEDSFRPAKLVMNDSEHDLALLRVDDSPEPLAPLSDKSFREIRAGMSVLFSGYPLNLNALTTHQGILSAVTKDAVGVTTYLIDGTVNPGNSGCPLMNMRGEVLGVVNATKRERIDILTKMEQMKPGAISLHNVDLVEMYQALISNVQLGIGYAVPASYIPTHKEAHEHKVPDKTKRKK
jgi:S1-C subfamily serine protease